MRVYIINADGLIVSREAPAEPEQNEIVVASVDELLAARLSGKQLPSLWNGLPGAEKRTRVGNREALIGNLWSAMAALPDPEPLEQRRSEQAEVLRCWGATIDEIRAVTGWQAHTVRGVFSGVLKKNLGLAVVVTKEERGRGYRITNPADA